MLNAVMKEAIIYFVEKNGYYSVRRLRIVSSKNTETNMCMSCVCVYVYYNDPIAENNLFLHSHVLTSYI